MLFRKFFEPLPLVLLFSSSSFFLPLNLLLFAESFIFLSLVASSFAFVTFLVWVPLLVATSLPLQAMAVTYRLVNVSDIGQEQQQQQHQLVDTPTIIGDMGVTTATTSATNNEGPFYVMMVPDSEIITTPNQASSRKNRVPISMTVDSGGGGGMRTTRDEKRRATHNEVERRRRDKINTWIVKLAKIVPDCNADHTKQGQSKGGILAKACEHINELTADNAKLGEIVKENELLANELDSVRQQLLDAKNENRKLKDVLKKNGIEAEEPFSVEAIVAANNQAIVDT